MAWVVEHIVSMFFGTGRKRIITRLFINKKLIWAISNVLSPVLQQHSALSVDSMTVAHSTTAHRDSCSLTTAHSTTAHSTTAHRDSCSLTTAHSTTAHSTLAHRQLLTDNCSLIISNDICSLLNDNCSPRQLLTATVAHHDSCSLLYRKYYCDSCSPR